MVVDSYVFTNTQFRGLLKIFFKMHLIYLIGLIYRLILAKYEKVEMSPFSFYYKKAISPHLWTEHNKYYHKTFIKLVRTQRNVIFYHKWSRIFFLPLLPAQFYKYYHLSKAFCREKTQIRRKLKSQDLWIHLLIYVWGAMPSSTMENRTVNWKLILTSKKLNSEGSE